MAEVLVEEDEITGFQIRLGHDLPDPVLLLRDARQGDPGGTPCGAGQTGTVVRVGAGRAEPVGLTELGASKGQCLGAASAASGVSQF
jgi:hypothetical protein